MSVVLGDRDDLAVRVAVHLDGGPVAAIDLDLVAALAVVAALDLRDLAAADGLERWALGARGARRVTDLFSRFAAPVLALFALAAGRAGDGRSYQNGQPRRGGS